MSDKKEHSPIGASGMYRWEVCAGSVRLSKNLPDITSRYAAEGTVAHDLGNEVLTLGIWPVLGQKRSAEGHDFVVDAEMIEGVQLYVETVYSSLAPGDQMFYEHHFDLSRIHPRLGGTADAVTWKPDSKILIVDDFKYGAGVLVTPNDNHQQMYYGLGALLTLELPAREVWLRITQPRIDHPEGRVRVWKMPAIDLLEFWAFLKERAVATEDPNAPLVAGKHCQFCKAIRVCPALAAHSVTVAKMEFAPAVAYEPEKLAEGLRMADALEHKIKAMREFAYQEALQGRSPPGWKLVAKRAHRKWKNEAEAEKFIKKEFTFHDWELFEPRELKSPAQMEKILPKHRRDVLVALVDKKSSGSVLVEASDPRPPALLDAATEFSRLEDATRE